LDALKTLSLGGYIATLPDRLDFELASDFITVFPPDTDQTNTHRENQLLFSVESESLNSKKIQKVKFDVLVNTINNLSPSIACIDDSFLFYQSLENILTEHGYRCYGVQDPLKIMPSLIRNKPDLILLDLLMPITNGYEVCEEIRKTPSLKHIPVVILTSKDGLIDRMRSKQVGANDFLGKPIESISILKTIEKHLSVGE
jgi:two-component system, chemotaxis family, response regulator PixG